MTVLTVVIGAVLFVAGWGIGYLFSKNYIDKKLSIAKKNAEDIIEAAKRQAEEVKKNSQIEAREEAQRIREEAEEEARRTKKELKEQEERLIRKEENLSKKEENLERKEVEIEQLKKHLEHEKQKIEEDKNKAQKMLSEIAELTPEQAREIVLDEAKKEYNLELAKMYKELKDSYEEDAKKYAKWVISTAIQRYAADYTAELTIDTVSLPSEDMKGRIIGREGRNIRAFEKLTGTDLIIDDTPEVVTISCTNPLRREVARLTLEKLVADGRIHPARIEEMYEKAKEEIESAIKEAGQDAVLRVGVSGLHPELVSLLGRLKFRTSYGQNVLQHSIEVAHLAALMASELDLNVRKVKRAALLHDIGKAVDHEVEGSHAIIGGELAKRYKEKPDIVNMIQCHHGEVEPLSPEAVIVAAADAISASRPGARRETLEMYIKRIEKLEEIASSFDHVEKAYAIQAGREVRIIVEADKVDDAMADKLAYDVAKKIEEEVDYPGQLKVTVIREKRSVAYAK